MEKMEFFNLTAAALFKLLLAEFPQPIHHFITEDFRTKYGLPQISTDPMEPSADIGVVIDWLTHEGFIRTTGGTGWGASYTGMVLTSKGLAAINRVPDSLQPTVTVGDRLKELSMDATKEAVASVVRAALSFALPGAA